MTMPALASVVSDVLTEVNALDSGVTEPIVTFHTSSRAQLVHIAACAMRQAAVLGDES